MSVYKREEGLDSEKEKETQGEREVEWNLGCSASTEIR